VTQFPHAVLEVKLQLATGASMPDWVADLLSSGCLREMPKFSKFVHGTAFLKRSAVRELPYWCAEALLAGSCGRLLRGVCHMKSPISSPSVQP